MFGLCRPSNTIMVSYTRRYPVIRVSVLVELYTISPCVQ